MASEVLALTVQIVTSHASMTELSTKELVQEIKTVYGVLASLAPEALKVEAAAACARQTVKMVESPEAKAVENEAGPVLGDPDYIEFMDSREG